MDPFNDNTIVSNNSTGGNAILVGRVTKTILGRFTKDGKIDPDFAVQGGWSAVGSVKFNLFQETSNPAGEVKSENFARPLFANIKQYPLEGEIVLLVRGPSNKLNDLASATRFYYISTYNIWNDTHHNAFPDLVSYTRFMSKQTSNQDSARGAKGTKGKVDLNYPLGDYFNQKSNIKSIVPFEGDIIFEGRHGQSIRFGSTVREQSENNTWSRSGTTGDPITIITNKRAPSSKTSPSWIPGVEDVSKDGSCIWLSSGQSINLDISKYKLDTFRLGFLATYAPDTLIPLRDISPGIQTIASAEYDKRVLDNLETIQPTQRGSSTSQTNTANAGIRGGVDTSGIGIDQNFEDNKEFSYNDETSTSGLAGRGGDPVVGGPRDAPSEPNAGVGGGGGGPQESRSSPDEYSTNSTS